MLVVDMKPGSGDPHETHTSSADAADIFDDGGVFWVFKVCCCCCRCIIKRLGDELCLVGDVFDGDFDASLEAEPLLTGDFGSGTE